MVFAAVTVLTACCHRTGDIGYYDAKGLHFSGRAKNVIKPKGYQVFPEDVEGHIDYLCLRERGAAIVRQLRSEGKWDRG